MTPEELAAYERGRRDVLENGDGDHTFAELYAHRVALTAALAEAVGMTGYPVWRSKAHHPDDAPIHDGYFIVGIDLRAQDGSIMYHYPLAQWDLFHNARELPHAPRWDGSTPDDTVRRLCEWVML